MKVHRKLRQMTQWHFFLNCDKHFGNSNPNHNSFRVLFDNFASVYFIWKDILIFYRWKCPAQGTGTVPVVSAQFRSLCVCGCADAAVQAEKRTFLSIWLSMVAVNQGVESTQSLTCSVCSLYPRVCYARRRLSWADCVHHVCRPNVCGSGRHGRRCCAGWTRAPGSARCLVRTSFHLLTCTKQGSCLENEIMQGTMPGASRPEGHARPGWTTSRHGQDSPWKSQSE